MRAKVTRVKDLKTLLKDLERYVKAPDFLYRGRSFRNFGLLPREVLANWLICSVGNYADTDGPLTFATDPMGGDGLIVSRKDGKLMFTEHVFIPKKALTKTTTVEDLMIASIKHKNRKGPSYASGKHLIVFSDARGEWKPTRLATKIAGTHSFDSVWALHLEKGDAAGYTYAAALLDLADGQAPIWRLYIDGDFKSWHVERIQ
jgi:hypothetical protein